MENVFGPYNPTMNLVLGCTIALLASCLTSLAVNLQASALHQERILNNLSEQDPEEWLPERWALHQSDGQINEVDEESETSSPEETLLRQVAELFRSKDQRYKVYFKAQWYIGFLLYIVCQVFGSVIALGYISPMILAPLGSLGLIFNIVFSCIFSGTVITHMDWIGTCLIVVGCAIISAFGSNIPEPHQTIPKLIELFTRPAFIAYLSVEVAVIVLIFSLIKYLEYNIEYLKVSLSRSVSRRTSRISVSERSQGLVVDDVDYTTSPEEIQVPLVIGREIKREVSNGSLVRFANDQRRVENESESSPLISRTSTLLSTRTVKRGRMSWLLGILYSCAGGIVASITLLLTKSGVEMVLRTIVDSESEQIHIAFAIFIISLTIITAVLQVYSLNSALKYQLPLMVLPLFFTFFTCLSLTNTMVYLDAFGFASASDFIFLIIGMIILIGGISTLGR